MEEAPSSPRSAALYYWGGDEYDGSCDDSEKKDDGFVWREVRSSSPRCTAASTCTNANTAGSASGCSTSRTSSINTHRTRNSNNMWDSSFKNLTSSQRRPRQSQIKFCLTIQDDDDDTHWMLVRPHANVGSKPPLPLVDVCAKVEVDITAAVHTEEIDEPTDEGQNKNICDFDDELSPDPIPFNTNSTNTNTINNSNDNNATDFTSIPIINLSHPLYGPNGYASQIGHACRTSGFFYIVNHGVDTEVMEGVLQQGREFFHKSLEEKLLCGVDNGSSGSGGYRGYFGIGMEDLENKDGTRDLSKEEEEKGGSDDDSGGRCDKLTVKKGDYKEGFDCGLENIDGYHENQTAKNEYLNFFGENIWPEEASDETINNTGFRKALVEYQRALLELADKLLVAFAVSLNENSSGATSSDDSIMIPDDYFIARSRNPMCTLRLLHYPPNNHVPSADSIKSPSGCGAHTDYGLFTILQQDSIGGLQVRNRSNAWIDAHPLPGSFVINVGDMLSWWTGGEYASTVHRVISPSMKIVSHKDGNDAVEDIVEERNGNHRYSVPFFFNPDYDAVVKRIRGEDVEHDEGEDYHTAIEVLRERYSGTFQAAKK
eukprot:scaffold5476_cov195-Alexandrium_tamarense.AAC.11